ncbi:hypothetical protein PIROE2DRAFT_46140, partial [Piromyces sp. E2]
TPLHIACKNNNETIVKYLIEHGADINIKHYNLYTMLHYACENKNENLVKYLIEKGANIYIKNKLGDTPLEIAQKKNAENIMDYIEKKRDEYTKLLTACENNNENIVKDLVEQPSANVNIQNKDGNTALHLACQNKMKTL